MPNPFFRIRLFSVIPPVYILLGIRLGVNFYFATVIKSPHAGRANGKQNFSLRHDCHSHIQALPAGMALNMYEEVNESLRQLNSGPALPAKRSFRSHKSIHTQKR